MGCFTTRGVRVAFQGFMAAAVAGVAGMAATPATVQADCDWTFITDTGPTSRRAATMVYDSNRNVYVLWGGEDGSLHFQETWEWDGNNWTLASTGGMTASARSAMAFDSVRNVSIVFGGRTPTGRHGEHWEWDGTNWTQGPGGPSARNSSAMTFDSARGVAVLFGGQTLGNALLGDTWEYNGTSWTLVAGAGAGPSNRQRHAMVYDAARGHTVVFGGDTIGGTNPSDTWAWDGQSWMQLAMTGPPPRRSPNMTYDPTTETVILTGGHDGGVPFDDTWEWDGIEWTLVTGSGPNPARFWSGFASSPSGESTLFGGDAGGGVRLDDTWELECDAVAPCYADCNGDDLLNIADFLCFIDEFAIAQALPPAQQQGHYANCTGSTSAPFLTVADFLCFIDEFALGCP